MKEKKRKFRHEHGGSFSVDYYAYASRMRSWNAGFKVLFSIISLLLCIACNNLFVSLAVIFFMGFLTVAVGGLKLHHYISDAPCSNHIFDFWNNCHSDWVFNASSGTVSCSFFEFVLHLLLEGKFA